MQGHSAAVTGPTTPSVTSAMLGSHQVPVSLQGRPRCGHYLPRHPRFSAAEVCCESPGRALLSSCRQVEEVSVAGRQQAEKTGLDESQGTPALGPNPPLPRWGPKALPLFLSTLWGENNSSFGPRSHFFLATGGQPSRGPPPPAPAILNSLLDLIHQLDTCGYFSLLMS